MKKNILALSIAMLSTNFVSAQNSDYIGILKCVNANPEVVKSNFIDIKKGGRGLLNLEVNWGGKTGGAAFAPANLKITNGTLQSGKVVGQIGANNPKQTWVIKVNDVNKPVRFAWQTAGTTALCGNGWAQIATMDFQ